MSCMLEYDEVHMSCIYECDEYVKYELYLLYA